MDFEDNKGLVRHLFEEVFTKDASRLNELVADDYVDHTVFRDREGLRKAVVNHQTAYKKVDCRIEQMLLEGDRVAVQAAFTLHRENGEEPRQFSSVSIFRLAGGKIVEGWGRSDSFF